MQGDSKMKMEKIRSKQIQRTQSEKTTMGWFGNPVEEYLDKEGINGVRDKKQNYK